MNGVRKDSGVMLMAGALVVFLTACSSSGVRNDRDMYKNQVEELTQQLAEVNSQLETLKTERDNAQTDKDTLETRVADLETDKMDLEAEREGYKMDLEALEATGRAEDQAEITRLKTLINGDGTDANPGLDKQIADLQMELDGDGTAANPGLRQQIAELEMELDGDGTAANPGLRQQIADLEMELDGDGTDANPGLRKQVDDYRQADIERQMAAEREERIMTEGMLRMALLDPANRPTSTVWVVSNSNRDLTGFSVMRGTDDMVTVSIPAYQEDQVAMAGDDWTTVMFAEDDRTVVFVTDIEAPEEVLFTSVYGEAILGEVLGGSTEEDDARRLVAVADEFPTSPNVQKDYREDGGNPTAFPGTLDGVPGTFRCKIDATVTECNILTTSDGDKQNSPNWEFIPDHPMTATLIVPDAEHSYYAWWLKKGDTWDFEPTAGSTGLAPESADIPEWTGMARYVGKAIGVFTSQTHVSGAHMDSDSGHFNANAMLTAAFGNNTENGTMSGTIDGFVLNDQYEVPDWTLTLNPGSIHTTGSIGGAGSTATLDYGAGTLMSTGLWGGDFFDSIDDAIPNTVVGAFRAGSGNLVQVMGSFGAKREMTGN